MAGEILKNLRSIKGLTQTELAARAPLSLSIIQKMEKAKSIKGRRSTWRKAVGALGITLEEFEATVNGGGAIPVSMSPELQIEATEMAKAEGMSLPEWVKETVQNRIAAKDRKKAGKPRKDA